MLIISFPLIEKGLLGKNEIFDKEIYYKIMYCIVAGVISDNLIEFKISMACICIAIGEISIRGYESYKIPKFELALSFFINLFALVILRFQSEVLAGVYIAIIIIGIVIFIAVKIYYILRIQPGDMGEVRVFI